MDNQMLMNDREKEAVAQNQNNMQGVGVVNQQSVPGYANYQDATQPKITTFNDLCRYKQGQVVELPPFAEGQPFVVRMIRPSLMVMVKSGKIPNQLMQTVTKLFDGEDIGDLLVEDNNAMSDMYSVMEIMCEASMLEPTYQEVKNAGLNLTDEQMSAIFSYAQTGVASLQPFH